MAYVNEWVAVLSALTIFGIRSVSAVPDIETQYAVDTALGVGQAELDRQKSINEYMFKTGVDEKMGSSSSNGFSYKHMHGLFRRPMSSVNPVIEQASVFIRATQELTNMFQKPVHELRLHPSLSQIWHSKVGAVCKYRVPKCVKSYYRTADGSCNNLAHPTWGMSHRGQKRYLPSDYEDGVSVPRMHSVTGKFLPSARSVSNFIHGTGVSDLFEPVKSAMVMQWGQVLDHDFAHTPTLKGFQGATVTCCNLEKKERSACFPIPIPPNDKHFLKPCMNFVRSAPVTSDLCDFGERNQMNQATSYIDASFVYGVDDESMNKLRLHKKGYLKMTDAGFYAPDDDQNKCMHEDKGDYCMRSGDPRIHVVPGMTSVQILFLREHNRIATILGKMNPHWGDETTFQEARKIVMAINQHITYKEYLPLILGPAHMKEYGLFPTPLGYNTEYNPKVDATMANSFGVAAFRFGHSQVSNFVELIDKHKQMVVMKVEETFNRPTAILSNHGKGYDHVNRWLYLGEGARSDRFLEHGVRNKLFLDREGNAFDLAALNIQRGRDHGVPGYNAYRKWCGLPVAFHFSSGPGGLVDHDKDSAMLLSKVYSHPDDIDLFSGGLSELHVPGGDMGPTFACINARQFKEMKIGDRFWYENKFHGIGFTEGQLNSIKHYRLSKMLCNNGDHLKIPKYVFKVPSKKNPYVDCRHLPDIDFSLWKDLKGPGHLHPPPIPGKPIPIPGKPLPMPGKPLPMPGKPLPMPGKPIPIPGKPLIPTWK